MTRIHLAKPGRYADMHGRAITLDADRIRALAASYDPTKGKAPLVLGHPSTDDPAHGWIDALEVDAKGHLWGVPSQVTPALAEAVAAGRYRNVSISWWPKGHANSPSPDVDALKHVGILGAAVPAIPGLKPLEFGADEDGVVTVEMSAAPSAAFSESTGMAFWGVKNALRNIRDWFVEREGVETADRIVPNYVIDNLDDAGDELAATFSSQTEPEMADKPKTSPVDLAARTADLDQRQADIERREAEQAKIAADAQAGAATSFAGSLVEKGLIAPSAQGIIADIHGRLSASDEPFSFADGSTAPAVSEFEKLFESAVPVINLAAVSNPDNSHDAALDGKDPGDLRKRAKAIQKEDESISFSAAVRQAEKEAESQ